MLNVCLWISWVLDLYLTSENHRTHSRPSWLEHQRDRQLRSKTRIQIQRAREGRGEKRLSLKPCLNVDYGSLSCWEHHADWQWDSFYFFLSLSGENMHLLKWTFRNKVDILTFWKDLETLFIIQGHLKMLFLRLTSASLKWVGSIYFGDPELNYMKSKDIRQIKNITEYVQNNQMSLFWWLKLYWKQKRLYSFYSDTVTLGWTSHFSGHTRDRETEMWWGKGNVCRYKKKKSQN